MVPVLARQARLMAEEAEVLEALSADLDAADAGALCTSPPALARRAVRRWLRVDGGYPPDAAAVERVLEVASGAVRATDVAPSTRVRRSRGRLSARPVASPSDPGTGLR
ncbi:MAG TPA: hypothetical protein DCQ30_15050 [Acidimicrobiaceae bacterium]|nr:hypothetical protein [Acidimicrobiaceae bacterium]